MGTSPAINHTKLLGEKGEQAVVAWLKKQKYSILAQNYRTKWGEIDVIATKGDVVAFIEVKTRKTKYFPLSLVVTPSKQLKLIKTAKIFASQHQIFNKVLRFDIATITINNSTNNSYEIDYIPNAFQGE